MSVQPPTRVVIAEDEAIIRMDLREILEEEGYDVVGEVARGDEVCELVRTLRPEVAVLDVKMPGLDGVSAARVLIDERLCAVVLLTAFSQRELITEARDAGVMSYVVKPFEASDLVPAIEMALGRFNEVRTLEDERATLARQLETRKLLDRAKGILADRHGLGEQEAFRFLQRSAMDRRVPMDEVSREVVDGVLVPPDSPSGTPA